MPDADSRCSPPSATDSAALDEGVQLELHLQRQLEEDVARIFDESIYSDIEVVCGKLKILTHSCILKARTTKFYHKLQTILHVNISRSTFDEIYSFISDTYTECNITNQEKEILNYLKSTSLSSPKKKGEPGELEVFLSPKCISSPKKKEESEELEVFVTPKCISSPKNKEESEELEVFVTPKCISSPKKKEESEELEVFLTPKCISPFAEKNIRKSISSSPSTDLTKEYYALVPIEGNLLEKELIEQDVLSSAFQSIISSQNGDLYHTKNLQCNKPTSLALVSSHTSKIAEFTNSYDISRKNNFKQDNDKKIIPKANTVTEQNNNTNFRLKFDKSIELKNCNNSELVDKHIETTYSPDSLITDDPSSASDYLSAAFTFSPGVSSVGLATLNVDDNTKMENIITSSDSGLENTGLLESLTSHKDLTDITLTDMSLMSLTESTLCDLTIDDASNCHDSASSPVIEKQQGSTTQLDKNITPSENSVQNVGQPLLQKEIANGNSSKEEKQRQNEEIVILESSSLSSETGSWESVFPPKCAVKDACEKFINNERHHVVDNNTKENERSSNFSDVCQSLVQKSPFKSTSCFIDAASLVDEEDETIKVVCDKTEISEVAHLDTNLATPSQPVPCSTHKSDLSPNDWSENDNEDSLEQLDNKDPDSIQKDLSPTIFEMTPITEDSLCANTFEPVEKDDIIPEQPTSKESCTSSSTVFMSSTPHNSIMSLKASSLRQYESEESESDTTVGGREGQIAIKNLKKYHEASPIVSGGASIEDHLPVVGSYTSSPSTRRKIENIPIVSGAYIPPLETEKLIKSTRPPSAPAWVVDMSSTPTPKSDTDKVFTNNQKKPCDKTCDALRNYSRHSSSNENCSKSRSSVDSDSSDRSSHKFYIDLSSIPVPDQSKTQNDSEQSSEKKNMFSMYIDFSEKPTLKEMPSRLSSLNTRKNNIETKNIPKNQKLATSVESSPALLSKSIDPNSTIVFEKYESLCNDPNISISEIIHLNETKERKGESKNIYASQSKSVCSEKTFQRNLQSVIQEEGIHDEVNELFVKLSDLDKPVPKNDTPTARIVNRPLDERMTRSIPENNWRDQSQAAASRSNEVISSFHSENALSLNRLFPHLRNEFSRSMPGSLSSRTRSPLRLATSSSPGDIDDQISDASEMSSVQSSFCRSIVENSTTEETSQASSLIGNCQSRLGQDLLRMFLEEIAPDVIVEVSGRRIKAHKCILSSRCQYFAGILSGGWVESAGNVIALPSFSFNVVHFALCHIYSGVSTIPDSISILELATLADMLGLEGLKEAIMFTLKAKYCHHFHRPCAVCTAGVLECFPLSSAYGLDDLYRKCLKWIAKYFSLVWPTKAFATLPSELLEKCYQQIVVNFNLETIVDTAYGCGITVEALQNSRWAEVVARLCRRLVHAAAHYIAPKLVRVLRELAALPPAPPARALHALHECVAAAIDWAPPDECCRAYALLASVVRELRNYRFAKPDLITNGNSNNVPGQDNLLYVHAPSWILQCEGALVRAAPRVCCTQAFIELPSDLRKRLRELGCIMYGGQLALPGQSQALQNRRSRSTHHSKAGKTQNSSTTKSLDIDQMRASFVPYAPKPTTHIKADTLKSNLSLHDPKKVCRTIPPKVRTTKAQEERAKFNLTKTTLSQERLNTRPSAKTSFENTKPRYLEPKNCSDYTKLYTAKKLAPKIISSSESSRNSSPIQARNLRTSRMKLRQENETKTKALSQDSLATGSRPRTAEPSTDSHSESQTSNKYATYTKTKHTSKGSIDTVRGGVPASTNQTVTNGRVRTKIPVYLNQISKVNLIDNVQPGNIQNNYQKKTNFSPRTSTSATTTSNTSGSQKPRQVLEKNLSCSLMNATKSSSAKMVTKVVKEMTRSKNPPKNTKNYAKRSQRRGENEPPVENIPVMERSGTFLKDEPTFGDKTTNIDLDQ